MQYATVSRRLSRATSSSTYLDRATSTSTRFAVPFMASILNLPYVTHLTGNNGTSLDGLSAGLLASLPDNTRIVVGFAGGIIAQYRIRPLGGDAQSAPWIVTAVNAPTRAWQLEQVVKEASPCVWLAAQSKFFQQLAQLVDGVAALVLADTGFSIPELVP